MKLRSASLAFVIVSALAAAPVFSQGYIGQLGGNPYGNIQNPYDANSIENPYGQYGNPYSNLSATNPYATEAPQLYDQSGTFRGNLSSNQYDADSISNPYGRYGNPYSADSVNNPFGAGNPFLNDSPNNPYGSGWQIIGR